MNKTLLSTYMKGVKFSNLFILIIFSLIWKKCRDLQHKLLDSLRGQEMQIQRKSVICIVYALKA